jgi:serine/threonine-protein kinase
MLMPVAEAVEVIQQTCRGLAVAHGQSPPLIHRDVKPENILVGFDGQGLRIRVGDFGLAKSVYPLTLLASARGTLHFKPPEALGSRDSTASDVWAVGTTLYLLLADRLPYPELDARDVRDARRFLRPIRPASVYNIQVDARLDAIVSRCLAVDASDRYQDAVALLEDLDRWETSSKGTQIWTPSRSQSDEDPPAKLGDHPASSLDAMVTEALRLAKVSGELETAADLLERATAHSAEIRARYANRLRLWRRGVAM